MRILDRFRFRRRPLPKPKLSDQTWRLLGQIDSLLPRLNRLVIEQERQGDDEPR
jgi:hypothetical protein